MTGTAKRPSQERVAKPTSGRRAAGLHLPRPAVNDQPLRLLPIGSAEAEGARFAARMYVAADGGPIRTIVGDGHRHFTGEEPSQKTGLSNPYEGPTEHALIIESELRSDVLDYRTQAFRLRLLVGGAVREWICDHLRHIRKNGVDIIESIECKPDKSFVDEDERAVHTAVGKLLRAMGWQHRLVYLRDIRGSGERQINFGEIYAHQTTHIPEDRLAVFDRMCLENPNVSFRQLRAALHENRLKGTAMAHALICRGRVVFNLDRYLFDASPVQLLPATNFRSLIRL